MYFSFLLVLILIIFFEGAVTSLPLILIFLLCAMIIKKNLALFPIAFFAGILLDILQVRTVGSTSIYFLICLFLVLLYQKKYEINSYPFVAAAGFLGSAGFLLLFGSGNILIQSIFSVCFAVLLYALAKSTRLDQLGRI